MLADRLRRDSLASVAWNAGCAPVIERREGSQWTEGSEGRARHDDENHQERRSHGEGGSLLQVLHQEGHLPERPAQRPLQRLSLQDEGANREEVVVAAHALVVPEQWTPAAGVRVRSQVQDGRKEGRKRGKTRGEMKMLRRAREGEEGRRKGANCSSRAASLILRDTRLSQFSLLSSSLIMYH